VARVGRRNRISVFTPNDMDYFINTLGGLPNWEQGCQWIIDQYGTYSNTPSFMAMADPIPRPTEINSFKDGGLITDRSAIRQSLRRNVVWLQYPTGPDKWVQWSTEILIISDSTRGYEFSNKHEDN